MTVRVIILVLALCFSGALSAEQPLDSYGGWIGQADLQVGNEEAECTLSFDAIPDELTIVQGGCCRVCRKGKACGNSCINRNYTCRQPRGCACDG
ncbi:hypothetical protein EHLJMEHL_01772 [Vreelandella titanicae]